MDFEITMLNMLKDLVGKVDTVHGQIGDFSREMATVRKSPMKC